MRHVGSLSRGSAAFRLIACLGLPCLLPALPEGAAAAESSPDSLSSEQLRDMLLSDEQIQERCRSAIARQLNLISLGERRITRCQLTYEVLRSRAQRYLEAEEKARDAITAAVNACLKQNATPAQCDEAGKSLASTAVKSHEALSEEAAEAERVLASLGGS